MLVFLFAFLLVSNIYANGNSYEEFSSRCGESSSCSGFDDLEFSKSRNCQCDPHCAEYGDCCYDSPYFRPSPLTECIQVGNWNTRGDYVDNYYMVQSCPSSWHDAETRSRCEHYMDTIRSEPILGHPVTSNATNITYVNYHCARCNNDLQVDTMIRWKLAVTCKAALQFPIPDIDTVLNQSTVIDGLWFRPRFPNASFHTCQLVVWRPLNMLRRCYPKIVRSCPSSWENETVKTLCESYTSFVFRLGIKTFRNPHCAICNGHSIDQKMECAKDELEVEHSFPILFDFSDSSGNEVGKRRICSNANEAYDPMARRCRNILWSIAGQEGNYEVDGCPGNMSICAIQNCSRFVLNSTEYVLNNDFTATDLSSNKVYNTGEFRIMDDGQMEMCAIYQVTEEKFDDIMQFVTFLGLGVSIAFLCLHLAVFLASPVLRNLSGKNMASLCTSLVLAYSFFIIGQLSTVGELSCRLAAIVTFYSFLASFSWLLLLAFDVWRALRMSTVYLRNISQESRRYVFLVYCFIGWLVFPGTILSLALLADNSASSFRPGFGVKNCWIFSRKALLVFFGIPIGMIMLFNILFFISSTIMIYTATMSPSNTSSTPRKNYRLILKLALLMGLSWAFGFVASATDNPVTWYFFVAVNAFQGLFIFMAFTWTKKVKDSLKSQISGDSKPTSTEQSSSCFSWRQQKSIKISQSTLRTKV